MMARSPGEGISVTAFGVLACVLPSAGQAPIRIYLSDHIHCISAIDADGAGLITLISPRIAHLRGPIAASPTGNIYWTESVCNGVILRQSDIDGITIQDLNADGARINYMEFDTATGTLYVVDSRDEKIFRATEDDTRFSLFLDRLPEDGTVLDIAIDPVDRRLYWVDHVFDVIRYTSLDIGSKSFVFVSAADIGAGSFRWISVDPQARVLYGASPQDVFRIDLDDLTAEPVFASAQNVVTDLVAIPGGGGFCMTSENDEPAVRCVSMDGKQVRVISDNDFAYGITRDPVSGDILWNSHHVTIRRADLEIEIVTTVIDSMIGRVNDIAVDVQNDRIYWSQEARPGSSAPPAIGRANLDGSQREFLLTETVTRPQSIIIDPVRESLYFKDRSDNSLSVTSLDGSEPEELAVDMGAGFGTLALDELTGLLYWDDDGQIVRFDTENGITDVLLETDYASLPQVDPFNSWMFWQNMRNTGEGLTFEVLRAHLDSGVFDQVVSASPYGFDAMAFDPSGERLYYVDGRDLTSTDTDGANPALVSNELPLGQRAMVIDWRRSPGDRTGDGQVDMDDTGGEHKCITGPGVETYESHCGWLDMDANSIVDLQDLALFWNLALSGTD
ncbi:MAG: hypothetical protein ACYTHJ_18135 [Planctomycetota bacterium]|jgi:sugar lactone lactonase YvrE